MRYRENFREKLNDKNMLVESTRILLNENNLDLRYLLKARLNEFEKENDIIVLKEKIKYLKIDFTNRSK